MNKFLWFLIIACTLISVPAHHSKAAAGAGSGMTLRERALQKMKEGEMPALPGAAAENIGQSPPVSTGNPQKSKRLAPLKLQPYDVGPVPIKVPPSAAPQPGPVPAAPPPVVLPASALNSPAHEDKVTAPRQPAFNIDSDSSSPQAPTFSEGRDEKLQIQAFRDLINNSEKQIIHPDKRSWAELARNYMNRISCEGQIEKFIVPQDQGLEAALTNNKHDLFLRVGINPNKQFPVDITFICDGQVYLVNALVHPGVPSQEIVLAPGRGTRPLSGGAKAKYRNEIDEAEALPLEDALSRISKRVYQDDLLPYWRVLDTPVSQSRWKRGSYAVLLQKVVRTEIKGIIAWDFVFRGSFSSASFYDEIRKVVKGELIAFGKVNYPGHDAARVIVLTREGDAIRSAKGR